MLIKVDHRNISVEPMPAHETKCDGLFLNYERKIYVSAALCPPEQAAVFLHELIHAIWAIREFPYRLREEGVCAHLAPALATVMRDNSGLLHRLEQALCENVPIVTTEGDEV